MSETNHLSLYELNRQINLAIKGNFNTPLWVRAEVSELRENKNGHCYLELIEKDEKTDQITARLRATIWSSTYKLLKPYFENSTGHKLTNGIKILIQGGVEFQELYGISFNIYDIDPNYTLGDLEQKKQLVIQKLTDDGIIDMNKELELPLVIQKLAIISSPTAAGYGDFVHQLENNFNGIKFYHHLYPAIMQGDNAAKSISEALDKIFEKSELFDAVILIRGGGATADLLCFDDYWLAYNITQFPLPILTGIGHERDFSIADMVAHTHFKTPTAVAEFLISKATEIDELINSYAFALKNIVDDNIKTQAYILNRYSLIIKPKVENAIINEKFILNQISDNSSNLLTLIIKNQKNNIRNYENTLNNSAKNIIKSNYKKLEFWQKEVEIKNPQNILERGFTLTTANGKVLKSTKELKNIDKIRTYFKDGTIESELLK